MNPPNRSNSPFRATETTIDNNSGRFTFISTFNSNIPRYNFTIVRLSNIFRTFLYISNKQPDSLLVWAPRVTTTFAKPRLNCDLNFVMQSSRKRPRPLLGLPNWTFPLFLSSCKRPVRVLYISSNALMKLHTALMVILI